jgi:hypothetical protein
VNKLPVIPVVNGYFFDGTEDLEPRPQICPGGSFNDLADVDNPPLLYLSRLLLAALAGFLLTTLAVAVKAPEKKTQHAMTNTIRNINKCAISLDSGRTLPRTPAPRGRG